MEFHWPILGHSQIKGFLQNCISNNTIGQAYLFVGPRSVGKFLTAQYLSASILCESNDKKKPCNTCQVCQQIKKNIHPDVDILKKEPDKKNISIQQIRLLQHKLSLRSFLTKYKIAIIDEAESLSEEAANALLKTLEEPTTQTIIILVAEHKEAIPSTIISRCQTFQFNLVPSFQIQNWLVMQGVKKSEADNLTHLSEGQPGKAVHFLENPTFLEQHQQRISQLLELVNGSLTERLYLVNNLAVAYESDTISVIDTINDWMAAFRDALLYQNNINSLINTYNKNSIITIARKYLPNQLREIISQLFTSKQLISRSINVRLALENSILSF
jgi:DNA polymerase III subunit delta'